MKLRRVIAVIVLVPVAGYVTWDQIESRALAREIAAIAARGEPITLDAEPAGADTPERHDAARIYAAAAERVRGLPQDITFRLGSLDLDRTAGPPLDLAQLEQTYRADSPALQLLDQATPLDFNGFGDVPFDRNNSPFLTLHSLAALRADLFSIRARGDAAAQALIPCVRLRRAMTSFNHYFAMSRLLGSIRIMLRHSAPSEAALAAAQRSLLELPDRDDLVNDVQQQRALFIDEITRPPRGAGEMVLTRLLRPWIVRAHRRNLESYATALDISRRPWPDKYIAGMMRAEKYNADLRNAPPPGALRRTLRNAFLPEGVGLIGAPFRQAAIELSARRVAITALAVERYRRDHGERAPSSLDVLVPAYLTTVPTDPFSGGPLMYRVTADHYLLYSIDSNRTDDGGALYGFGSGGQGAPLQGATRDLGIRVDIRK